MCIIHPYSLQLIRWKMRCQISGILQLLLSIYVFKFIETRPSLPGANDYFIKSISNMVNAVEEEGLSTLRPPEKIFAVNRSLYGLHVNGTVTFKDGFCVKWDNVTVKMMSTGTTLEEDKLGIKGTFRIIGLWNSYNMLVSLDDIKYFGSFIIRIPQVDFKYELEMHPKDMNNLVNASFQGLAIGLPKKVDVYPLPESSHTTVLTLLMLKKYSFINSFMTDLNIWSETFQQLLQKAARNIPFPEIEYL